MGEGVCQRVGEKSDFGASSSSFVSITVLFTGAEPQRKRGGKHTSLTRSARAREEGGRKGRGLDVDWVRPVRAGESEGEMVEKSKSVVKIAPRKAWQRGESVRTD